MPKFSVSSEIDLIEGLKQLGVTDCFDPSSADFSPLMDETDLFIGKMQHGAHVEIDEKGVVGAAVTMTLYFGTAAPLETIEFTLDRPFIFVVESDDGMPLFVGIINQIG
jgi:serpin B